MALALSLVGQPVQPYLTTGATDFVNSVQKGKEDAAKLKQADTVNQKSALDILSAKKKVDESSWATTNATDLKAKADKGQLDAESMARMQEANPEFAKLLGTAQADAVKNFYASNLIGLNSATDQTGFLNGLVQAHDAHNAPLPESVRKDPKLAIQYYKMLLNGAKAFDDKTASMDESGNVITKDALGNTTAIDPAAVKATKALPTDKTIDVPLGKDGSYVRYAINTDGSRTEIGKYNPPAQKAEKTPSGDLVQTVNGWEFVPKGQIPKGAPLPTAASRPSEDENKATQWAVQAQYATDNMAKIFGANPKAANQGFIESYLPESFANYIRTADRQQFQQAASSFAEAALRAATGAGVTESEAKQKIAELTPVWGDKAPVITQKLNSIPLYLASLQTRAGRGLAPANEAISKAGDPFGLKKPIQVKTKEDYNRLKSGDVYLDPNGVKRTKS